MKSNVEFDVACAKPARTAGSTASGTGALSSAAQPTVAETPTEKLGSDAGVSAATPPPLTSGFPWGKSWVATYRGRSYVWKLDNMDLSGEAGTGSAYFEDKDGYNITFNLEPDGTLHGTYDSCRMRGRYNPKTSLITVEVETDEGCPERFGRQFTIRPGGGLPASTVSPK